MFSYVSKNRAVHGTSSATRPSSARNTGLSAGNGSSTSRTSSWSRNRALSEAANRSAPRASRSPSTTGANAPTTGSIPAPTSPARTAAELTTEAPSPSPPPASAPLAANASCTLRRCASSRFSSAFNGRPCRANCSATTAITSGTLCTESSTYAVSAPRPTASRSHSRTSVDFPTPPTPCTWKRNRCVGSEGAPSRFRANSSISCSRPTKAPCLRRRMRSWREGRDMGGVPLGVGVGVGLG